MVMIMVMILMILGGGGASEEEEYRMTIHVMCSLKIESNSGLTTNTVFVFCTVYFCTVTVFKTVTVNSTGLFAHNKTVTVQRYNPKNNRHSY